MSKLPDIGDVVLYENKKGRVIRWLDTATAEGIKTVIDIETDEGVLKNILFSDCTLPPGKTLTEVTQAARLGEPLTADELRFAVCAYDVLMAQLKVERHEDQLIEFFKAGDAVPEKYLTPANHPDNPDFVSWYRTFLKIEGKPDASQKP